MRRFFAARKREPAAPPDAAPSSASSSSGSTDHAHIPVALPPKRTWKPWTAAKRSLSLKSSRSRTHLPDWSAAPPLPHPASDADESDADDDDDDAHPAQAPPPPPDPARAQHVLRLMLSNAAAVPPSVSPFTQQPDGRVFPRSINPRNRLPPPPADTRVAMLTKHLASRLHTADLSPAEIAAISPLALRPLPVARPHTAHPHDASRPPTTTKILPASPGLRRWIARPCFEDRYVIYSQSASGIDVRPISSSWAIAALEYPEHLDVMVNPDFDQSPPSLNIPDTSAPLEPTLAATLSHASTNDHALVSAPAHSRNSYTAVPSPLRNEHPPVAAPPKPEDPQPVTKLSGVKRVVRFQEDDSDDGTPLHIVRMKKKRDEKSNFLRQEQLKRARDEDFVRRKEAQRILQEATERERQRLALEKERKDKEKAHYAEQILATRARREQSRAGGGTPSSTASSSLLVPSSSSLSLRDAERNNPPPSESRRYSRVNHDAPPSISIPRREASDQVISNKRLSDSSSPDSSRPPSLAYSPGSPAQGHSRPPSTYSAHTSSSEDVRHQSGSKRNSLAPSATSAPYARPPIIANYTSWSGSNPNLQYIPAVPPFPDFITDMPLLPPAAPFMKHARPRSTSSSRKDSSPGPSTSSSRRGSMNSSTERVNLAPKGTGSASSSRNPSSSPRPPQQRHASTPAKPTHERRMSSDSRATTQTQRQSSHYHQPSPRPVPVTSRSHPVLNRGRSEQPAWPQAQFMQVPMNPWMTGMPMAVPMPVSAPAGMPYMMPVYPMMPMMTSGSQTGLHGAANMNMGMNMGTPRRDGGTQGRRAGEKWAAAIS
ncbi:hypothetical protein HYPSUDRAFT_196448 [Hypholoma sublateritium FD-334 SS-4]|uniref:Uncharacterized protein n=1 Tax=Hypholoma sublateritium (strain FD-334 SS-4) TaxID=945553 RepID=A0A0D2PH93_HYPSF|nr:hypothetical protein HYPSUDRAFT_196448 [Hypholoma sublateritium FD-334 SS-4]